MGGACTAAMSSWPGRLAYNLDAARQRGGGGAERALGFDHDDVSLMLAIAPQPRLFVDYRNGVATRSLGPLERPASARLVQRIDRFFPPVVTIPHPKVASDNDPNVT